MKKALTVLGAALVLGGCSSHFTAYCADLENATVCSFKTPKEADVRIDSNGFEIIYEGSSQG
ncbi:membrane lipoprotein [Vibrio phage 1.152.O._10N.222.46.E1]|uniref:Membrane lipoprotein n=5 Tax=Nahantvirus 49C7 TaxID=2846601 RepID=A0A2I7RBF9_9CAUD|nr:membrane lipoprotein [Vibrio phage 1.026.O._10N.222.49.C7]AUR82538.1 membrane lipoprotein [Vibrio phage 1.025.O._10N.222.46.B6]AUR90788.1 membrane lipoprotein [Vibrio phage 1.150.O._10N.222.46.A6]AUR90961.1 membrane lipoprotein [Vibrio phage 1.152.O._10N.222.46.E1]AUS02429.1 membrane lipoprotein [Vibrio phage 2.130.O._10N.222.46.C2]AUR82646.1 membrane lipoprotein [Vibrio phage 1.026.O._10N.222.49.C7]